MRSGTTKNGAQGGPQDRAGADACLEQTSEARGGTQPRLQRTGRTFRSCPTASGLPRWLWTHRLGQSVGGDRWRKGSWTGWRGIEAAFAAARIFVQHHDHQGSPGRVQRGVGADIAAAII